MKKISLLSLVLCIFFVPFAFASSFGIGITPDVNVGTVNPEVWQCDGRVVLAGNTAPGRISPGDELISRMNNYAFEGEQVVWRTLVYHPNGISNAIQDVVVRLDSVNSYSVSTGPICSLTYLAASETVDASCNAIVNGQPYTVASSGVSAYYDCIFTVSNTSYGEYWLEVVVTDNNGNEIIAPNVEYWFLNPVVGLGIDGSLAFDNVVPGSTVYSQSLLVENLADAGSGVMLDMFISGSDFYDSSSSGALCPTSNVLSLSNWAYRAFNGAYSTNTDIRADAYGYIQINPATSFNPTAFYDSHEIMQLVPFGPYYLANVLAPGAEFVLTFRLDVPQPCIGNFDSGSIFFWGQAI
ncbi:MAG: hypothetical protein ACMXYG_03920 [Candidatus Woesearchaeota archaeon]